MIALYFLIPFWFVPMQIILAVVAERIARKRGLTSGDYFVRTLFFGYPSLAALCSMPDEEGLFTTPLARRLLELVLIQTGCPALALYLLLFCYCLPETAGQVGAAYCSLMLLAWYAIGSIAVPMMNIWIVRKLRKPTRSTYAAAIFAQSLHTILLLDELTKIDNGITEQECSLLRTLLIPCAVPSLLANFFTVTSGVIFFAFWVGSNIRAGFVDIPLFFMCVLGVPGVFAALAVSPLACYLLADKKKVSRTLWTPVGLVLPVIAPLFLATMKSPEEARDSDLPSAAWNSVLIIHAQALLASIMLIATALAVDYEFSYDQLVALFALLPTWMLFCAVMPYGATKVLAEVDVSDELALPKKALVRATGFETVFLLIAMSLLGIRLILHSTFF